MLVPQNTRSAEDNAQTHELQVEQLKRDRDLLQSSISRLEGELVKARRAQDILDDQIQENVCPLPSSFECHPVTD